MTEMERLCAEVRSLRAEVERLRGGHGPKLLTSAQVADRLSVSVRSVWRFVRDGRLPRPLRFNRKMARWRVEDLERAGL